LVSVNFRVVSAKCFGPSQLSCGCLPFAVGAVWRVPLNVELFDARVGILTVHCLNTVPCAGTQCDATMYHMKKASVRDLRYEFKKIERLLLQGEVVQITKRRRVIARLTPEAPQPLAEMPDFLHRLRAIYGRKVLRTSGARLMAEDRSRY
jgi:antitoxin (DNA-binding transcriptional repressor) of toxin-antitoxin stability system